MARQGITFEQVSATADALVGEGQQPTIKAVRDRLTTGSPNTIHEHLKRWREARPVAAVAAPELPQALTAAIAAEIERAAAQARGEIEGRLVQAQAETDELTAYMSTVRNFIAPTPAAGMSTSAAGLAHLARYELCSNFEDHPDWFADGLASAVGRALDGWPGERWLDVNITKQTLVAYDGKNPVYATLVSTGEAGLGDPEKSKSTKRGIFRIHTKHVAATMDSDTVGEEFELQDIPYVQYFEDGYALHTAYWHDDFGRPRSHGCINLSPQDARWLFFFTDPKLPEGWHSVRKSLTGSVVFVHQ